MKKLFNVVKKNNTTGKKLILIVTDISPRFLGSVNALNEKFKYGVHVPWNIFSDFFLRAFLSEVRSY